MAVTVYSTETCPYCHKVKDLLEDKGVSFKTVSVDKDSEGLQNMMEKTGGVQSVPVVDIDGEIIIGYDKDKILAALEEKGLLKG